MTDSRSEMREGEAFGRNLFDEVCKLMVAAMEEEPAKSLDLLHHYMFFKAGAAGIETAADARVRQVLAGGFELWRHAARAAYCAKVAELMAMVVGDFKKRAPAGKVAFNRAIKHIGMTSTVLVCPAEMPGAATNGIQDALVAECNTLTALARGDAA